jgi:hypothetical protein
MLRTLALPAISLAACNACHAQAAHDEIYLRATVQKAVVPLADFSGSVIPVDIDPRFALTVRIESTVPAAPNFIAGAVVTLAIHSPSLLFAGGPTTGRPRKGRTYDFVLYREIEDGKVRFIGIEARRRAVVDITSPSH